MSLVTQIVLIKWQVTRSCEREMTGCYEILSGITEGDFLADPSNPNCAAGAATGRREPKDFTGGVTTEG